MKLGQSIRIISLPFVERAGHFRLLLRRGTWAMRLHRRERPWQWRRVSRKRLQVWDSPPAAPYR